MSNRKIVNYTTILKRSRCLNSTIMESTVVDSNKIFDNLNKSIETKQNGRNADTQRLLRSYIESLCCTETANSNYYQIFDLLEEFNDIDPVISDRILTEYVTRILPYTENIESMILCLEKRDLTENQKNVIFENASAYNVADRILKNHTSISKRFNIERECNRIRTVGLKYFIDSCAEMIDTYKIKDYQKMNLLIEECYYILEKNHIDYNKHDMLKYAVEFYLIQNPYISEHELNNFRRAINENYILEESDIEKVQQLLSSPEDINTPYKSINDAIQRYLVNCSKTDDSLPIMMNRLMIDTNKQDILTNIENLIYLLWGFVKNKTFESDEGVYKAFKIIPNYISGCTKLVSNNSAEDIEDYSKEDLISIIGKMNGIKNEIEMIGNSNPLYASAANNFIKKALNPAIDSLSYTRDILYGKDNLDSLRFINSSDGVDHVPLGEFKIFKFHNLVNAAFNLNKFLKVKEKKFINSTKAKVRNFVSRTKNILFGEMAEYKDNIFAYIGEDCKANICVRQYSYTESELTELTEFLDTVCNEYNDLLISQNLDSMRAYYIINPGIAEINIKEAARIELTEAEKIAVSNNFDNSVDIYLETFIETSSQFNSYDGFMNDPIEEQLLDFSKYDNFTYEHFEAALEAMSYLNIDESIIKVFGEKFSDYQFNKVLEEGVLNESYVALSKQEKKVTEAVENWEREEDVLSSVQLEAYGYLLDIIEEASKPPVAVGGKAVEERSKKKKSPYYYNEDDDDEDEEDVDENDKDDENEGEDNKNSEPENKESVKSSEDHSDYYTQKKKKPFININSIKLGLRGLRQKFKDMNTKQKEMSRNLDNSVRSVVNSMKQSLVSDRREAIIKGSLIPSFSRCIKAGIGLTIMGVLTNGVTIPIIVAIGGLAVSKKLNDRERALLLDEIETEIEVVDKELAIADSNNQIKKYRALLQYKKELQRQYQRIRYNIRVGKGTTLPSSVGMKNHED